MGDKRISILLELQAASYDEDDYCTSLTFSTTLPHTLPVAMARTAIYRAMGQIFGNVNDIDISLTRSFAAEAYCFTCFRNMGFDYARVEKLADSPIEITISFP